MFDTIVGHSQQRQFFERILNTSDIAHAYSFEGVSGIGKASLAMAITKTLLCANTVEDCIKFDSGNHPDFLKVEPEGSSIKVEQIEAIHGFVHMKPYLANVKVVIIDQAPMMTEQAQNKLLKLIEEPPGHAVFLLISENAYGLLPTVRSRLIRMFFHPLSEDELIRLINHKSLELNQELLAISMGSMGRYIKWIHDDTFTTGIEQLFLLLCGLCENKASKWLKHIQVFETLKDDGEELLQLAKMWFQDLLLIKEGASAKLLRLSFQHQNMVQCSQYVTSSALLMCIDRLEDAIGALKKQQNYQLVTESVLYRIQEAIHG
jgi:DNA polymerase-3 subunit delta'